MGYEKVSKVTGHSKGTTSTNYTDKHTWDKDSSIDTH